MTNSERLISFLGFTPSHESVEGELIDAGIECDDDYEAAMLMPLKKCAINLMEILLTTANTGNNDGFNISYDRGAVERRILLYKKELGIEAEPTIRGIRPW